MLELLLIPSYFNSIFQVGTGSLSRVVFLQLDTVDENCVQEEKNTC